MQLTDLLAQLAALGGLAALIAVLVDALKRFGIVQDGDAPTWVTGFNLVALIGLFVAGLFKVDIGAYDPMIKTLAQLLTLVLSLIGQVAISRATHATLLGVKAISFSYSKTLMALVMLGIVASVFAFAFAPVASADGPADYRVAMVKCSGLTVSQLAQAQQSFDTQYGFDHQLTTPAQWANTYEARSNEFAISLGCNAPLSNGVLTFWYRIYEPIYARYAVMQ